MDGKLFPNLVYVYAFSVAPAYTDHCGSVQMSLGNSAVLIITGMHLQDIGVTMMTPTPYPEQLLACLQEYERPQ
jgi:hypothetical protein